MWNPFAKRDDTARRLAKVQKELTAIRQSKELAAAEAALEELRRQELYAKSDGLWPAYTHQGYYRRGFQEGFRAGQEAGVKLANDIMNCCAGPSVIVDYKALSGVPYTINSTLAPGTVVLRDKGLPTAHIYADSVSTIEKILEQFNALSEKP